MITDTQSWHTAYLNELEHAAVGLPAARRSELLAQVNEHLDRELASVTNATEAQLVLDRLGDPYDVAAEAAKDLPGPAATGSKAAEIVSLLLLGIGGFALPLIAPFIGVLMMLSTPRWTPHQVRMTGFIVGVGLLAVIALMALAASGATSGTAMLLSLLLLLIIVLVGPAAALYAATRKP